MILKATILVSIRPMVYQIIIKLLKSLLHPRRRVRGLEDEQCRLEEVDPSIIAIQGLVQPQQEDLPQVELREEIEGRCTNINPLTMLISTD